MFIEKDFEQIEPSIFEEYDNFASINKLNTIKEFREIGMSSFINSILEELNLKQEEEKEIKNLIYKNNKSDLNKYIKDLNIEGLYEQRINKKNFKGKSCLSYR